MFDVLKPAAMLRGTMAAAAMVLTLLAGPVLAQSERVDIPGTGLSVVPPEGFEPSGDFMGFVVPENGMNFVLNAVEPAAYEQLLPAFSTVEAANEFFGPEGLSFSAAYSFDGPNGPIPYLRGEQEVDGVRLGQWLALAGGEQTVFVTVNMPPGAELSQADFETLLASLEIGAPVNLAEQVAALPFLVDAAEPFALAQVVGDNMVALVDTSVPAGEPQPAIIVDAQFNISGLPPLAEAAGQLVRAISDFAGIEIDRGEAAPFAGGEGWLLSGIAEDPTMGTVRVMQWLGQRDGDLIRLVAYAPVERFDELRPAIEAVAAGVQWK